MSQRSDRTHRRQNFVSGNNAIAVEILEPRWLNAASPLQVLALPNTGSVLDNTAPVVVTPLSLSSGSEILGRTATVSVLASDDKGESELVYSWQAVTRPAGASVSFSSNGSNAAKNSTVTFSRAGTYSLRVSIQDRDGLTSVSSLEFNVSQSFTSLSIRTADGKAVAAGGRVNVAGTTGRLNAVALDQFGSPMTAQPAVEWQLLMVPSGGTARLTTDGAAVSVSPDRAGLYELQAQSGSKNTKVSLSVTQTLSTVSLSTVSGASISSAQTVTVTEAALRINIRGFDQFGNAMTTLPAISWTAASVPTGGRLTPSLASGVQKLAFNLPGNYALRAVSGSMTFSFSASVVATLTGINFRTQDNRVVPANSSLSTTGTSQRLTAVGLDQFGVALADQPQITWQLTSTPTGADAKLTQEGNGMLVRADRAGAYALRADSGSVSSSLTVNVNQLLSSLTLLNTDGTAIDPTRAIVVVGSSQSVNVRGFDQFGNAMTSLPAIKWTATTVPTGGAATTRLSSGVALTAFTRAGNYTVSAQAAAITSLVSFQVLQTLTKIAATGADNRPLNTTTAIIITGTSQRLKATGLDQFAQAMADQPIVTWSVVTAPAESSTALETNGNDALLTFTRYGAYTAIATSGSLALSLRFTVAQTLTNVRVTPGTLYVSYGTNQQFLAQALDQFAQPLLTQPAVVWSATGGTITSRGLFTAGSQAGSFMVTVKAGTKSTTAALEVAAPVPPTGLRDPALTSLVNTYYADGRLSRLEMIEILRSVGSDGMVDATELADFQFLVSSSTPFSMPGYVQQLASSVVNSNPANRSFKGQTAGNLVAGSSSTLLNNLVDKWFLGTDEPLISGSGFTYQTAAGNLFNATPSRADARQGMLGDCYLIAALSAIADRNPDAVRNMFVDNGDGTYAVRFYAGVDAGASRTDYVTVNRRLPASASGTLAYSGYGLGISAQTTTLWIALAEKAYAQWNETGNEGRDGTNRYAAIEGGWMSYVNAQVLGYNSSNYSLTTTTQQTLIGALSTGKSVTIGTLQNASSGGLYGSHAYIVTGYNSTAGTFTLHNPWGVSHPSPLSFGQLQTNCSMFVVTDPTVSAPIGGPVSLRVRSTVGNLLLSGGAIMAQGAPMTVGLCNAAFKRIDHELPAAQQSQEPAVTGGFDLDSFLLHTVGPGVNSVAQFSSGTTLSDSDFMDLTASLIDLLMMDFSLDKVLC